MSDEIFSPTIFGLGAKKDPIDRRDFRAAGVVSAVDIPNQVFEIPESFAPNNQFQRPSCTSQAQSHHKERQESIELSARFIMALTKKMEGNTNEGAYTRNTFKIVNTYGACRQNLYPEPNPPMSWVEYIDYTKIPLECYEDAKEHKSESFWRVENAVNDIKRVLIERKNTVVISMEWFSKFNNASIGDGGILPIDNLGTSVGGHAIEVKGFDDFKGYLKLKNSWGNAWGDQGFCYMPYDLLPRVVWDAWCSLDIPAKLPVDLRYGLPRTWQTYLLEKKFAFDPWIIKKISRLPNNREIIGLAYGNWDFESVFKGRCKEVWLYHTKPEARKLGLIDY